MLISKWAFNWEILPNPDSRKLDQELLFSGKRKVQIHAVRWVNNSLVERTCYHKHLNILLDENVNFKKHNNTAIMKIGKYISVIKKQSTSSKWILLWKKKQPLQDKSVLAISAVKLMFRRFFQRLSCMLKIMKDKALNYLTNLLAQSETNTRIKKNSIKFFHFF